MKMRGSAGLHRGYRSYETFQCSLWPGTADQGHPRDPETGRRNASLARHLCMRLTRIGTCEPHQAIYPQIGCLLMLTSWSKAGERGLSGLLELLSDTILRR
ncbi:hypothetical protein M3J09_007809 [Ascochyta lentis]